MIQDRLRKEYQFLTKNQKKVADFFLTHGDEAAFLTIYHLAQRVKTSQSTIVRFSRSMGYKGYLELQKDLRRIIKQKISPPETLQHLIVKERGQDFFSKIFEIDFQNLRNTRKVNENETIKQAVKEILSAKKVGFTGFRSSYAAAYLIYFLIGQVKKNCELLGTMLGSLPNQLVGFGRGDLILGISFLRYSAQTLRILNYAKREGCRTIAITDDPVSPIGQIADLVLIAGAKSATYFNSFSSTITLINCLAAGVSLKSSGSVNVLKSVNQIVKSWEILLR